MTFTPWAVGWNRSGRTDWLGRTGLMVGLWATLALLVGSGTVQGIVPGFGIRDSGFGFRNSARTPNPGLRFPTLELRIPMNVCGVSPPGGSDLSWGLTPHTFSTGLPVSGGGTDGVRTKLISSPTANPDVSPTADSSPAIRRNSGKVAPTDRGRVDQNSKSPERRDSDPGTVIVPDDARPGPAESKNARPEDDETESSGTTRPDTSPSADTLPLAPRRRGITFSADRDTQLSPSGVVRGTVTDRTGRGIAGATITVEGAAGAVTGTDGDYLVRAVTAGHRRVTVHAEGYSPADSSIVVSAGRSITVDFRLRPSHGDFRGHQGRNPDHWNDWAWWHDEEMRRRPEPFEWIQTYSGRWVAAGYSVTGTSDGGFLAAGMTMVPQGASQLYLVKTSDDGSLEWERYITIDSLTSITSAETTYGGGYVLLGTSLFGAWVVETDARGREVLNECFDARDAGPAARAILVGDGGYLAWEQDGRLAKYASDAHQEWKYDIPRAGPEDDGLEEDRLLMLPDKGWLIHDRDLHCIGLDSLWRPKWSRNFSEIDSAVGLSLRLTEDSGFVAAGFIRSLLPGRQEDIYMVKTDRLGFRQWERVYGDSGIDQANCVLPLRDRGFVIAGDVGGTETSPGFGQIMKTDSLGNPEWTIKLRDPGTARSVRTTRDGGLIVVGTTYQSGLPGMYLLRLDPARDREFRGWW
jgi:hypothetical protein